MVACAALRDASSIAKLLLATERLVTEIPEKKNSRLSKGRGNMSWSDAKDSNSDSGFLKSNDKCKKVFTFSRRHCAR